MIAVCNLFFNICQLLFWVIMLDVIFSWLFAFNIVNRGNDAVMRIYDVLQRLVQPLFAPIRKILPTINGIDLSPLVFLLALQFFQRLAGEYVCRPSFF